MIVNINQCASMYDETLNVLKFSAVAQKVRPRERSFRAAVPPSGGYTSSSLWASRWWFCPPGPFPSRLRGLRRRGRLLATAAGGAP